MIDNATILVFHCVLLWAVLRYVKRLRSERQQRRPSAPHRPPHAP